MINMAKGHCLCGDLRFETTSLAVLAWLGDAATITDFMTGAESTRPFDFLVLACVNIYENALEQELADSGFEVHSIGDCVSPRQAPAAIYEGRELALRL